MITKVKFDDERQTKVCKERKRITDFERMMIRGMAFRFVDYLEQVQRMPLVVRLEYYRLVFHLYNLLRKNRQLGRREGGFDAEVREEIRSILSEDLDDDGTGKD